MPATQVIINSSKLFEGFVEASHLRQIQLLFHQICINEGIDPTDHRNLYEKFRKIDEGKANSKAQKLWSLLDKRRAQSEYLKQFPCADMNVLVIGAGPCGLRAAIEASLLGAKVIVVEQRDKFSRNNVLHLWEFVIQDLKNLGAKLFYPKFCTGSIEHISIRQLQCILTKVALVLGVQIHDGTGFCDIVEPDGVHGWRATFEPHSHLLSEYEFDVLIGADGKSNTLPGFPRQVVRGKIAIGITANFVNKKSAAEEKVQEIPGVAYIFNQAFFKGMQAQTGVDLENIVYYKDETHYFVMCAKKNSLLAKNVIKKDYDDVQQLLSRENVDQEMLCKYAMQAADFATNGKLPLLEYSVNHRGQSDVAMFDFTALYSALHSTHLIERHAKSLIVTIVGDSLHEPFWPTGSGCARGFLGVFDAAWMLRSLGLNKKSSAEVISERENVLKLLAQTTKEKMCKAYHKYTINPKTRYQTIARSVEMQQVIETQIDSDDPNHQMDDFYFPPWGQGRSFSDFDRKYRLLRFCHQALLAFRLKIYNFKSICWGDGKAICALVSKFRSDLVDYITICSYSNTDYILDQVFSLLEDNYGIQRPCCSHIGWINLSEERRVDYIDELINSLREDPKSVAQILSPTIKTNMTNASRKRSKIYKFDPSKAKKSEQIKQRTGVLLNAMASTTIFETNTQASIEDVHVYQEPEPVNRAAKEFIQVDKTYTARPAVQRLNPEVVYRVDQIVTGDLEKSRWRKVYEEKQQKALMTKKMEKESLDRLEEKLENGTAERMTKPSMSSQEEKEIDERLSKADNILKFSHLSGVHTVTNFKEQQASLNRPKAVKIPPPTLPKPVASSGSSFDDERENRGDCGLVNRSSQYNSHNSGIYRRPLSTPQDLYSSVLPRRKNVCALCGVEVYLAEQMHIDKVMIHKKCFKCSYCSLPLRLGNCGFDRTLSAEYGPKWFCQQHNMLHISEKIARIQKNEKIAVAVVPPTQTHSSSKPMLAGDKVQPYSSAKLYNSERRNVPAGLSLNTMEKMKQQPQKFEALKMNQETDRAGLEYHKNHPKLNNNVREKEFLSADSGIGKKSLESNSSNDLESSYDDDEFVDASCETTNSSNSEEAGGSSCKGYTSTEDECEDEEEVWTEFAELLENTLTKSGDCSSQDISELQATKWIESFNRKANLLKTRTPESVYHTPSGNRSPEQTQFFTPMSVVSVRKPDLTSTRMKSFDVDDTLTNLTSLPSEAYTTVMATESMAPMPRNSLFDNMPSLQRATLSSRTVSRSRSPPPPVPARGISAISFETPNRSFEVYKNDQLPETPVTILGASESQKEAGILDRMKKLRMRNGERRATVAIDPFSGLMKAAQERGREIMSGKVIEEKEEQQRSIYSGSTTTIEITDDSSSIQMPKMDIFSTPAKNTTPTRKARYTDSDQKKRLRAKTLTNGIQQEHLKAAMDLKFSPVIVASPKNIKKVQKQAERILKRREDERQRMAQEIQRSLDETENRMAEVYSVGSDLEQALAKDPTSKWLLENWLLYVQELKQLKLLEEDLHRRVKEISISEEYHKLKAQLTEIQTDIIPAGELTLDVDLERKLMNRIVKLLEEHQQVRKEMDDAFKKTKKTVFDVRKVLEERKNNFNNFYPIFTSQTSPNFDDFVCA